MAIATCGACSVEIVSLLQLFTIFPIIQINLLQQGARVMVLAALAILS